MNSKIVETAKAWSELGSNYASSEVHKQGPSLFKLLELARANPNDTCLDIGTGTGHTAAALAKTAKYVYGLDPSVGMRQAATELYSGISNLEFVDGTSENTNYPNNHFDIVTARHTLHHHPSMPKTLTEIKRVLKPGGRLIIVDEITPNSELNDWYHELEITRDPTHIRSYYLSEWQEFINSAGLKWIVGDAKTSYQLDIEKWIMRMKPSPEQANKVRQLFAEASPLAKTVFNIQYKDGLALSFKIPMAVILAVKPETN